MIKVSKLHGDYTSIETVRLLSGWGDGMIKVSQLHGDYTSIETIRLLSR